MGSDFPNIVKLSCPVKNYDWGKVGKDSAVASLYSKNSGEAAADDARYAEFWMGTHDSGPSYVVLPAEASGGLSSPVSLKDWIEKNPSVLGDKVLEKWGTNLPFLFKVLSVAKALSIQAHPDKGLAEVLHKKQPSEYKDDNHKPEMALALTEFEALCGFVSLQELKTVIQSVPEIVEVVGSSCADQVLHTTQEDGEEKVKDVLRSLFNHLMSASKSVISDVTSKLISRLNLKEKLKPGEALYLGANEPHAYLQGECVECMATSDNVGSPEILTGNPSYPYTVKYLPPFDEFEIELCNLPQGASTVFSPVPGPSIFIVLSGEGTVSSASLKGLAVAEGDVLFASANTEIATETVKGLKLCRAGINSKFFEK
ncbi:mannose-6-phosphate isomerase [Striga asiatica]|uniref:mannose-6-phosphate isomerase n=1 Tax=Striga asiatica TaxID=4170 RepID=A0A5A7QSU9_STRAF|nr:mannose-6-phosphate isomerase [Striga asiatica]